MTKTDIFRGLFRCGVIFAFATGLTFGGVSASTESSDEAAEPAESAAEAEIETPEDTDTEITRQGLNILFEARPILGSMEEERDIYELDYASIGFRITDTSSEEPVRGLIPGAWIDLVETTAGQTTGNLACRDRIGLYLRGTTGVQPMIDINSYFILVLNEDATVSVVDPNVLIAGVGDMFFTQVILPRPGVDWAQSTAQNRVFVSMPRADRLGVIDTESFKLISQVQTGSEPVRVAIQPDQRYVWVGNNAKGDEGGVTVVDTESLEVAAELKTGKGHHEIAFTSDDRFALVTNRDSGTASAIDIQTLSPIRNIPVGAAPVSVVYSDLSKSFYVADGAEGVLYVIDGTSLEITGRIAAQPGLGPMRATQDGRWVLVTNASKNLVHVIDASANRIAHDIGIAGKPYQVSMTRAFAYVRALESERVSLIDLSELGKGTRPPVVQFPLGEKAPGEATSLSAADTVVEAAGEAGVIAVDPVGSTLNYYMEGMNAPMGSFRSYGHKARAVLVTDRALLEKEPGFYSARIQVPKPGTFEAAFVLDSPPVLHCFRFTALPNPALQKDFKPLAIEYLLESRKVPVGEPTALRFRLTDPADDSPVTGLSDVRVDYYLAPGTGRRHLFATEIGDGVYEAELDIPKSGVYYVYISALSAKAPIGMLNYMTLRAEKQDEGAQSVGTN